MTEKQISQKTLYLESHVDRWLIPFRETGNPIYAWRAFFNARRFGLPIPEEVLQYLDGAAYQIMKIADRNPPKRAEKLHAELAGALGMKKNTVGHGSIFTDYHGSKKRLSDKDKRLAAIDAYFAFQEWGEGKKEYAKDQVAEKYKTSPATVARAYDAYLKKWEARATELIESGKVKIHPDGKIETAVAGTADDLREWSIIMELIFSRFHELQ